MSDTALQRAMAKLNAAKPGIQNDECWIWPNSRRYGRVCIREGKNIYHYAAHRLSFEISHGPIPDGLCVCHACDVPACFNPRHLWAGTQKDNALDRDKKKRGINSSKTHCKHGHEFDDKNTRIDSESKRTCKTCDRRRSLARYHNAGKYRRKAKQEAISQAA